MMLIVLFPINSLLIVDFGGIGSLLSGIGTIILAILGFRWKNEKRLEKLSDISYEALNDLDLFKEKILEWLDWVDSWIVYDRDSKANKEKYNSLSFEKQQKFTKYFDADKYEVHNFVKIGNEILQILNKIKNKILRLDNSDLESYISKFHKEIKNLPNHALHFKTIDKDGDKKLKDICEKEIRTSSKKICDFYDFMHKELLKYLQYR